MAERYDHSEIAAVRELQRLKAEAELAKAASRSRAENKAFDEAAEKKSLTEGNWSRAMAEPSLSLETARLWSSRLVADDGAMVAAEAKAARAERDKKGRGDELIAATRRLDDARKTQARLRRKQTQKREDAAVQDALDRHLQRRGRT